MSNFMRKPNIIVFLDVSPEQSYERVKMRARDMESEIPLSYLQNLARAYEDFIKDISKVIPVIRVDWNQFRTTEEMAERIKQEYEKIQIVHTVDWQHPKTPTRSSVGSNASPTKQ